MGISERSQREQRLTDQGEVYTRWPERRARYRHIFAPSNTVRADDTFDQLLREAVSGKQVLEIGCGTGWRRVASRSVWGSVCTGPGSFSQAHRSGQAARDARSRWPIWRSRFYAAAFQ